MRKQAMQMVTKWFAMMIAVVAMMIVLSTSVQVDAAEVPAAAQTAVAVTTIVGEGGGIETGAAGVATQILALQAVYPEGTPWTNETNIYLNTQAWSFYGKGCSAFAMQISDAVYGKGTPVSMLYGQTTSNIQVGDIVRISGIHSVVVTGVTADAITVCEGNYNSSVHWGRVITKASIEGQVTYIARRG